MTRLEITVRLLAGAMGDPQTDVTGLSDALPKFFDLAEEILAEENRRALKESEAAEELRRGLPVGFL